MGAGENFRLADTRPEKHDHPINFRHAVVVGLVADEGLPAAVAARLVSELSGVLTDQVSKEVDWQVHTRCDLLPMIGTCWCYSPTSHAVLASSHCVGLQHPRGVGLVSVHALDDTAREKTVLYNAATLLTLFLGVAIMYAVLDKLTLLAAATLIDSGYLKRSRDRPGAIHDARRGRGLSTQVAGLDQDSDAAHPKERHLS